MRARHRHFSHKAAGAVVAYDARYLNQSNGTALQTWPDRAGAYDATESDPTKQPLIYTGANGINGQTALNFDGTNDDLQATNVPLNTFITIIICGSQFASAKQFLCEHGPNTASTDGFYMYGDQIGAWSFRRNNGTHYGGNVSNWLGQNYVVGSLRYDGSAKYRKNGGENLSNGGGGGSGRTNSSTTNAINICSRNRASVFSNGLLGCLAIYDGSATDSMLKRLEHAAAFSFKIACN